jgi:hypothetical protein
MRGADKGRSDLYKLGYGGVHKVRIALCKIEYEMFRHLRNIKKYTDKRKIF